jgi:hypothetical protein
MAEESATDRSDESTIDRSEGSTVDQLSQFQEYQKRLEDLLEAALPRMGEESAVARYPDHPIDQYQERLWELMGSAREEVDRQVPQILDTFAATAKNVAERFEDMASDARQRTAQEGATPQSADASERTTDSQGAPSASAGSGTADA